MPEEITGGSDPRRKLRVYVATFGCQMNEYDSQVAAGLLEAAGFEVIRAEGPDPPEAQRAEGSSASQILSATQSSGPDAYFGGRGVYPEILHFVQDDKRRPQNDKVGTGPGNRTGGDIPRQGHEIASSSAAPRNDGGVAADVILMNTCSVREHAEDRVYGRLGMLGKLKKKDPSLIIGLMGCMVEEHREKLFKRFPQLDLMVGTRNIKELPALIEEVKKNRQQVAKIRRDGISIEYTDLIKGRAGAAGRLPLHAWLPIMTGCDKVCTFCIVPITRGPEVSMPAREVDREASRLAGEGVKWITLLGQNVNSYNGAQTADRRPQTVDAVIARERSDRSNLGAEIAEPVPSPEIASSAFPPEADQPLAGGRLAMTGEGSPSPPRNDDENVSFPDLLERLCQIDGLERISFTTSHPSDATEELFQVIARNPKISRRFHLPLQSGSDRILKRMKRLHRYEEYKAKIDRLRALVPDIAITTDIIVGFSGETEEDYEATRRALEEIRYDGAYIFKYSPRSGTPAAKLPDDVPQDVKHQRNRELLALQREITFEKNRAWLGRTVEVFVEDRSAKRPDELLGRTIQEKKVVFPGSPELRGTFQPVTLLDVKDETFRGRFVSLRGHEVSEAISGMTEPAPSPRDCFDSLGGSRNDG